MCVNPRLICVESSLTGSKRWINASCGKCVECVKARQNSWKLRLCEEAKNWRHGVFFTLTYSDDALPQVEVCDDVTGEIWHIGTACKKHVQNLIKQFREQFYRVYGFRLEMKYFICAEYGSESPYVDKSGRVRYGTARPHYHGIIYHNEPWYRIAPLFYLWSERYGFVNKSDIDLTEREHRSATANYVSKYCCKGEFASRAREIEAGIVEPAWTICSKGIGYSYVERMKDYHLADYTPDSDGFYTFEEVMSARLQNPDTVFWDKIDTIVQRMKVRDGDYFYKMPRYYRERIYQTTYRPKVVKSTKEYTLKIANNTNYETPHYAENIPEPCITVKACDAAPLRYSSENWLSLSIAVVMDIQFFDNVRRSIAKLKELFPSATDDRLYCMLSRNQTTALKMRERASKKNLSNFYQSNISKYPKLNCA